MLYLQLDLNVRSSKAKDIALVTPCFQIYAG